MQSRRRSRALLITALMLVAASGTSRAESPGQDAPAWLCNPEQGQACGVSTRRLVLGADGSRELRQQAAAKQPEIDCFYVYPTVSEEPSANSSLKPGPGELRAVAQQLTPFAGSCRLFAPMYRQITLAGLGRLLAGQAEGIDRNLPYEDLARAWRQYLAEFNRGRGVVLIGHSQGSAMLIQLLQREIDGQPSQARLVSAVLAGYTVDVPQGKDVGGSFKQLPLCRSADQTGCVISYASFREGSPPSPAGGFGRSRTPGMEAACVDPVALSGRPAEPWFAVVGTLLGRPHVQPAWIDLAKQQQAEADFATLPGLIETRCTRSEDGASILALRVVGGGSPQRPADMPGDLISRSGQLLGDWGLHLVDINAVAGNLAELVKRQGSAWLSRNGKP
ncbi:DUF3089 domain-containing protein [Pelomonas sp. SE-A7]|uniref:DUF3089 domain-containing protein n=1 Tax=Pelomonas sp. SE-A7 TaxID=3054953 RepID=UPI00259D150B|nr:DUF3089 domain-containing protein [Pelomonas sp. SE-A7]MDM4767004.1 DUF3089 domain-containing protein [Pelomonas sp. SE-A7]